jgi:hypothetical protein
MLQVTVLQGGDLHSHSCWVRNGGLTCQRSGSHSRIAVWVRLCVDGVQACRIECVQGSSVAALASLFASVGCMWQRSEPSAAVMVP